MIWLILLLGIILFGAGMLMLFKLFPGGPVLGLVLLLLGLVIAGFGYIYVQPSAEMIFPVG